MSSESKPCILIVDDDEGLAAIIQLMLDRAGYDAHTVFSGQTALEWLTRRKPDAVILDLMMPDMSGFTLLRQWRSSEATRSLPVIVLTARVDVRTRRDSRTAGANAFLTKPVHQNVLIEHVREAIGHAATLQ